MFVAAFAIRSLLYSREVRCSVFMMLFVRAEDVWDRAGAGSPEVTDNH